MKARAVTALLAASGAVVSMALGASCKKQGAPFEGTPSGDPLLDWGYSSSRDHGDWFGPRSRFERTRSKSHVLVLSRPQQVGITIAVVVESGHLGFSPDGGGYTHRTMPMRITATVIDSGGTTIDAVCPVGLEDDPDHKDEQMRVRCEVHATNERREKESISFWVHGQGDVVPAPADPRLRVITTSR